MKWLVALELVWLAGLWLVTDDSARGLTFAMTVSVCGKKIRTCPALIIFGAHTKITRRAISKTFLPSCIKQHQSPPNSKVSVSAQLCG